MARQGKIARLPAPVREELNQRLRAGKLGPEILPWINGLPETQALLAQIGADPINANNLSDWRHGGYEEWENKHDRTNRIKELSSHALALSQANGGSIAQGASAIASGALLELLEAATSDEPDEKLTPEALREIVASLTNLRSSEIAQQRADLDSERLKRKDEELALEREKFELMKRKAEAYDRAEKTLTEARQTPGGLTPETLTKIERELKLL